MTPTYAVLSGFRGRVLCSVTLVLLAPAGAAPQQEEAKEALAASARNFKFQMIYYPETAEDSSQFTEPHSIDDAGVIVGDIHRHAKGCDSTDCGEQAFIYEHGKFTIVAGPLYKGNFTKAIAINNRGQILLVQDTQSSGGAPQYFLYDLALRTFSPVGAFVQVAGAPNKIRLTPITGFNDEGQFVGNFRLRNQQYGGYGTLSIGPPGSTAPPGDPGNFTQIECPEGRAMNATGINNRGQITGSCESTPKRPVRSGFLYSKGSVTVFDFPGASLTRGNGVNDAGVIAGEYTLAPRHAGSWPVTGFAYDGSQFTPVVAHGGDHGLLSAAKAINNKGQIAGMDGEVNHGFIATATSANPLRLSAGPR